MPLQENDPMAAITAILNATKDQKSTSTTSSNISSAGVNSIIQQILQGSQGLGTIASGQHVSGGYNSTVQQQQLNDLITRTAGEVAQKQAGTTTTNNKKAPLSGKLLNLVSTLGAVRSLGKTTGLTDKLTDLYDGISNNVAAGNIANGVSNGSIAAGAQPADFAALEDAIGTGDAAASAADATAAATTAGVDAGATDAATEAAIASVPAATTDAAGLEALNSAAATADAGSAATVGAAGADAAGEGLGAAAGIGDGALAATGWGALALATYQGAKGVLDSGDENASGYLKSTGDVGTSEVLQGLDSGNMADSINPVARDLLDSVGLGGAVNTIGTATDDVLQGAGDAVKSASGWIVCTELVKQNRMPKRFYLAGLRRFNSYDERGKQGYYYWAVDAVLHLRRNPTSQYSHFLAWVMNHRAEYIAASVNIPGARFTLPGFLIYHGLYAFCWILSRTLARKSINWSERVYGVPHGN